MSRNTPRRSSSRPNAPRPRRLAGQSGPDRVVGDPETREVAEAVDEVDEVDEVAADPARSARPPAEDADPPRDSPLSGRRMTTVLIGVVGVLVLLLVAQAVWFFVHQQRNDDTPSSAEEPAAISVPDDRPILASDSDVQAAAEAAASALTDIVGRNFNKYDEDVAAATEQMTERFASEYTETTDQIRDEFVANRTTVQARVVAQGIVRADTTRVEVLVFLNQYVTKGSRKDQRTSYTPYRAVVTMLSTDRGWLVDGLDTQ